MVSTSCGLLPVSVLCHAPGPVSTSVPDPLCLVSSFWSGGGSPVEPGLVHSFYGEQIQPQKEVTCPGHLAHGRQGHSEIQALRTDLCSVSVSGLHAVCSKLPQAFAQPDSPSHLRTQKEKVAFSPRCTSPEFICIGPSQLCGCLSSGSLWQ